MGKQPPPAAALPDLCCFCFTAAAAGIGFDFARVILLAFGSARGRAASAAVGAAAAVFFVVAGHIARLVLGRGDTEGGDADPHA